MYTGNCWYEAADVDEGASMQSNFVPGAKWLRMSEKLPRVMTSGVGGAGAGTCSRSSASCASSAAMVDKLESAFSSLVPDDGEGLKAASCSRAEFHSSTSHDLGLLRDDALGFLVFTIASRPVLMSVIGI